MTIADDASPSRLLLDLLEDEAAALTAADYAGVSALAERKSALLESLGTAPPEDQLIDLLKERSARNAFLYEATLQGLRSVIDRLQTVKRVVAHLDTYTAGGALQDLGPARSSFEKRS